VSRREPAAHPPDSRAVTAKPAPQAARETAHLHGIAYGGLLTQAEAAANERFTWLVNQRQASALMLSTGPDWFLVSLISIRPG
jgi:hypothetical protein